MPEAARRVEPADLTEYRLRAANRVVPQRLSQIVLLDAALLRLRRSIRAKRSGYSRFTAPVRYFCCCALASATFCLVIASCSFLMLFQFLRNSFSSSLVRYPERHLDRAVLELDDQLVLPGLDLTRDVEEEPAETSTVGRKLHLIERD